VGWPPLLLAVLLLQLVMQPLLSFCWTSPTVLLLKLVLPLLLAVLLLQLVLQLVAVLLSQLVLPLLLSLGWPSPPVLLQLVLLLAVLLLPGRSFLYCCWSTRPSQLPARANQR
jgi:hypothetical protein